MTDNVTNPPWCLVYFDGDCPLCVREIGLLRWLDRKGRIAFVDIADEAFDPDAVGLSMETLMARIHGRNAQGELIEGVEVFRQLYGAVGLWWLMPLTRLPGLSHTLDALYRVFAKNRLRWTGRCEDGRCEIPAVQEAGPRGR